VPRIRDELVATGQARFVARTYPVVYPWGEPAVQALEATFARSPEAFWGLFAHYFADQDAFSTDNVLPRTEEWLAANTDLDGAAVVADAEAGAYDDAVQVDLDAGEAAGVGRTTPTVFLFRDGEYVTRAGGSVSFDLITSALGL
jgi:protein-disulfide isomerase